MKTLEQSRSLLAPAASPLRVRHTVHPEDFEQHASQEKLHEAHAVYKKEYAAAKESRVARPHGVALNRALAPYRGSAWRSMQKGLLALIALDKRTAAAARRNSQPVDLGIQEENLPPGTATYQLQQD